MTDKPWEQQPPAPGEPSRIITPTDTITITIDNRGPMPQANMRVSRELPTPYVIGIMASLISQLTGDMMRQLMGTRPNTGPNAGPVAGTGGNHAPKA